PASTRAVRSLRSQPAKVVKALSRSTSSRFSLLSIRPYPSANCILRMRIVAAGEFEYRRRSFAALPVSVVSRPRGASREGWASHGQRSAHSGIGFRPIPTGTWTEPANDLSGTARAARPESGRDASGWLSTAAELPTRAGRPAARLPAAGRELSAGRL